MPNSGNSDSLNNPSWKFGNSYPSSKSQNSNESSKIGLPKSEKEPVGVVGFSYQPYHEGENLTGECAFIEKQASNFEALKYISPGKLEIFNLIIRLSKKNDPKENEVFLPQVFYVLKKKFFGERFTDTLSISDEQQKKIDEYIAECALEAEKVEQEWKARNQQVLSKIPKTDFIDIEKLEKSSQYAACKDLIVNAYYTDKNFAKGIEKGIREYISPLIKAFVEEKLKTFLSWEAKNLPQYIQEAEIKYQLGHGNINAYIEQHVKNQVSKIAQNQLKKIRKEAKCEYSRNYEDMSLLYLMNELCLFYTYFSIIDGNSDEVFKKKDNKDNTKKEYIYIYPKLTAPIKAFINWFNKSENNKHITWVSIYKEQQNQLKLSLIELIESKRFNCFEYFNITVDSLRCNEKIEGRKFPRKWSADQLNFGSDSDNDNLVDEKFKPSSSYPQDGHTNNFLLRNAANFNNNLQEDDQEQDENDQEQDLSAEEEMVTVKKQTLEFLIHSVLQQKQKVLINEIKKGLNLKNLKIDYAVSVSLENENPRKKKIRSKPMYYSKKNPYPHFNNPNKRKRITKRNDYTQESNTSEHSNFNIRLENQ